MKRNMKTVAAVALASLALAGCGGNVYKASATDTQLSAYAGQAVYPYNLKAEMAPSVFAVMSPDATITLYNAGDVPFANFELWVNQMYTLHVDKLDARTTLAISPASLFNKTGVPLTGAPANSITSIQILSGDKLWNVQGPIIPH
jgi:hypothetical protein